MKISIKIKFSVFLAVLLLFTMSILSVLVLRGIRISQKKDYEMYLAQQVKIANTYIKQMYSGKPLEDEKELLQENVQEIVLHLKSISGMYPIIYDMDGNQLSSHVYYNRNDVNDVLSHALQDEIAYKVVGNHVEYMAPLYNENQIGIIQFHYSLKKSIDFYNEIKFLFITIGAVVFVISFVAAYFYFSIFSKNIIKLKKDIGNIKEGLYPTIVSISRNDELGELSEGIFYMSSEIQKNIEKMEKEQKNLKLVVEKLDLLEKQQKVFIGNITHEFKTPLTVIKAYMDLLDMYPEDYNLLQDAKMNILKETQRLSDMVEKTLYLSSLQNYKFEFQWEKIDIKDVLEEACSRMQGKAHKFNISLMKELEFGPILGDRQNLMHIFINLIDNAIKYNNVNGEIFIKSYTLEDKVYIEVFDTGIGIPEEAREKIFDPFYTVNKSRSKDHGGTGLGLSLVKELIENHKGTISLLDTKGNGTKFLISFPVV